MNKVTLITGDVLVGLAMIPDGSIQCCVTSPPYWGLRDYGIEGQVWSPPGSAEGTGCCHVFSDEIPQDGRHRWNQDNSGPKQTAANEYPKGRGSFCRLCNAWRGSLGLEPTIEMFVEHMVQIFREVKRVLRSDGVCFINLGDSFSSLQSSRKEYIIREDLTEEEIYEAALGIRRHLPELWGTCWQEKVQGTLRQMLSEEMGRGTPRGNEGTLQEVLSETHRAISFADQESPEAAAAGNDNGVGREVCLLRGNRADVPVPGSYQDGGQEGIREAGRSSWGLAQGDSRGIASGQVPGSLLELQFGIRFIRFLSSLRLEIASIPKQLRKFFKPMNGLKPKDLCGIPWRVALALQADGWYLRSDIIWAKPNPMPESCTDRPTKSHEYIFLLTKSAHYFWDQDAVREEGPTYVRKASGYKGFEKTHTGNNQKGGFADKDTVTHGRNLRSVWEIATHPFPGAHFATFPPELVRRCVSAGTSPEGCCPRCGSPWRRVVEKGELKEHPDRQGRKDRNKADFDGTDYATRESTLGLVRETTTTGWTPTCTCQPAEPIPCTVLDPFSGAGTTALVAAKMGRDAIGIELNPEYVEMSRKRIAGEMGMLAEVKVI